MDQSSLYRLPDVAFVALIAASVGACLIHAARHVVRHAPLAVPESGRAPLDDAVAGSRGAPRHSAFQRLFHWTNAAAVGILVVSGLAIYGVPSLGVPRQTTAFWFSWHAWIAPAFAALVVAHVTYEFRARGHIDEMWLLGPRPGKYGGVQVFFHWAVAANLAALVLTGAVLWKPLRALLPLRLLARDWDFVFLNRVLHGFFTATLLAFVLAHLYFALLVGENRWRLRSMALGARGGR